MIGNLVLDRSKDANQEVLRLGRFVEVVGQTVVPVKIAVCILCYSRLDRSTQSNSHLDASDQRHDRNSHERIIDDSILLKTGDTSLKEKST